MRQASLLFLILIFSQFGFGDSNRCKDVLGAALNPIWVMSKLDEIKSTETPAQRRVRDATANYGFVAVALNNEALKFDTLYTKTVFPTTTLDQEGAGTCWIFAQLNVYRVKMAEAGIVPPDFKFSTNYVHFFDLLEKTNTRLTMAIMATEKFSDSKDMYKQMKQEIAQVSDGGWSTYLPQLVEKYGLVPYQTMPDTFATKDSGVMIEEINRQASIVINQMILKSIEIKSDKSLNRSARFTELLKIKETGMGAIVKILVTHLGHPPTKIDTVLNFKVLRNGKNLVTRMNQARDISPVEFAKNIVKYNKDDFILVRHYPSLAPGYYVVKRSSIGIKSAEDQSHDLKFINMPESSGMTRMQELIVKSIDAGVPIEFSADVMKDNYFHYGAMDVNVYDREGVYNLSPEEQGRELTKREGLLLGQSAPAHMMVIGGYDTRYDAKGLPHRYLVKNSWGMYYGAKFESPANKGVQDGDFHMSQKWLENYVYDINIPRRILSLSERRLLKTKPIMLTEKAFNDL